MKSYYLKSRTKNWAVVKGVPAFTVEYYGCFLLKSNADQAAALLRRINANTGRYFDTVEVVTPPKGVVRCLTWEEVLSQLGTDPRPYAKLAGSQPVNVIMQEALIAAQDSKA